MRNVELSFTVTLLSVYLAAQTPGSSGQGQILARRYSEGQKLHYQMKATNEKPGQKLAYEIQADGEVKKAPDGFFEEFRWSHLIVNGAERPLSPFSLGLRQLLTFDANPKYLKLPDLSKVDSMMIGPITDMFTFYADVLIAETKGNLVRADDHFYYPHGGPNSWADGSYVILGQDAIDFDVTLTEVDTAAHDATITVKHVPPPSPQIKLPADWMKPAVADTPNNWVEVTKQGEGKYVASVGKETFVARIKLSLNDGRMLRATLDNPVEVRERHCADAALTRCGEPQRYQILRKIEITSRE